MVTPTPDLTPKGHVLVDLALCGIGAALLGMASIGHIDSYTGGAGALALGAGIRGLITKS
jgi:hypothetical protein